MTSLTPTVSSPLPDEMLAARASHETTAFVELYRRHFPHVYRYHIFRTGNIPEAQDLTTQTFLAALEGIDSFKARGSFAAWLMGIARNKLAQHYRSKYREEPLEVIADMADPAPTPETAADQRLQLRQVNRALRDIKPERAEALLLCIAGELSASEAGKVMGKSTAAIKMLVMRGLRDLRGKFALALQEEK